MRAPVLWLPALMACLGPLRGGDPVPPRESERCGDGTDDDGDGEADEGCSCEPGTSLPCYVGPTGTRGRGACTDGTMTCHADPLGELGVVGECVGSVGPATEKCDGADDDCDGTTDEGCTGPEALEICDGRDNDGDDRIDEGRACGQAADGDGPCAPGAFRVCDAYCGVHQRCSPHGLWGPCIADMDCSRGAECDRHVDCPFGTFCDIGLCVAGTPSGWPCEEDAACNDWSTESTALVCQREQGVCIADCFEHTDCAAGLVCDVGTCIEDPYVPGDCP